MAECSKCGKQEMTFTCRYCGKKFCSKHRLPENHECEKLEEATKVSGSASESQWFEKKNLKQETVHGKLKEPEKPSMLNDVINTLKSNYTLAIIAVTVLSFGIQLLLPSYTELLTLSPALTDAAVQATNQAAEQINQQLISQGIGPRYAIPVLETSMSQTPWSLLTVMLVHGGLFHLFANMVTFYFFGTALERVTGGREMLKFYVLSGLIASIGYVVFRNVLFQLYGPMINGVPVLMPAVGASGAVVAVFAAVSVLYPDAEVLLYFFIPMKIKTALYLFAAIEGFNLVAKAVGITLPVIGGFASSAHLVGLAVGVVYGRKLRDQYRTGNGVLDLLGY